MNFFTEGLDYKAVLRHRTNKVVDVFYLPLGITYIVLMLSLTVYVGYFQIYKGGGYQTCEAPIGAVVPKIFGSTIGPHGGVWDAEQLVVYGTERDAMFLTTSMLVTKGQTQGECVGVSENSECTAGGNECVEGTGLFRGVVSDSSCYGKNGTVLDPNVVGNGAAGHCMLKAWCPLENPDNSSSTLKIETLNNVASFSVFIRSSAKFRTSNTQLNNLVGTTYTPGLNFWTINEILSLTKSSVNTANSHTDEYVETSDKSTISTTGNEDESTLQKSAMAAASNEDKTKVLSQSEEKSQNLETLIWAEQTYGVDSDEYKAAKTKSEEVKRSADQKEYRFVDLRSQVRMTSEGVSFDDIAEDGMVIMVTADWNCNLDSIDSDGCIPTFDFQRMDRNDSFAPGFGFEYISIHYVDGEDEDDSVMMRDLYSVKGIRFLFGTTGSGCRFDFSTLTVNVGAGLAIIAVASVVTDTVLMKFPWAGDLEVRDSEGNWIKMSARDAFVGLKTESARIDKTKKRLIVKKPGEPADDLTAPLLSSDDLEKTKIV